MMHSAPRKLRLTFFSFGILEQGGGFENYLLSTARGLAERYRDVAVSVNTMDPATVEKLQRLLSIYFMRRQDPRGIYRETYESVCARLGPELSYLRSTTLRELTARLKDSDVIYAKNEVLELAVLQHIGIKQLPPVIVGVHTPIYYPHASSLSAHLHNVLYSGPVYRRLLQGTRSVEVNTADDLRLVQSRLRGVRAAVVRQAIALPELDMPPAEPGILRLLFVGRLTEQKGVDLLLAVARALAREHPGAYELRIAGSGDPAIMQQVQQLAGRNDAVAYLGHVPNEHIAEHYQWADATLIPSRFETLNKVAIETAAAGKVAVAADIPGPRAIIQHGVTGFLVPRHEAAFMACLARLITLKRDSPAALQAIGRAAYQRVREQFDPAAALAELYNDISATAGGA